jgi:hypothetical protein
VLEKITKGKIKTPHCILIYSRDGIGKSTFASQAPNPIFLGTEQGTNYLDVSRFPTPKTWADVEACLDSLLKEKHDFKTIVIDSLDWLEPLLHAKICAEYKVKTLELAAGGYGKGYMIALDEFVKFRVKLNELRESKGMNIILIAHSQVKTFQDPHNQIAYDKFEIKLHKAASAMFREYVDAVLYAGIEVFSSGDGKTLKTFAEDARYLFTSAAAGYDAKNRMGLPAKIELTWDAFIEACQPESAQLVISRINELMPEVPDDLKEKVKDFLVKSGENIIQLKALENRIQTILNKGK